MLFSFAFNKFKIKESFTGSESVNYLWYVGTISALRNFISSQLTKDCFIAENLMRIKDRS